MVYQRFLCRAFFSATIFAFALFGTFSEHANALQSEPAFRIKLDTNSEIVKDEKEIEYSGRMFVFMSKRRNPPPIMGPIWFGPEPFFAVDVDRMKPGTSVTLDSSADHCPFKLTDVPAGSYFVQAVLDHEFYSATPGRGVGNFRSEIQEIEFDPKTSTTIDLQLTKVVEPRRFPENDRVRKIELKSELLSQFFERDVLQSAAIVLPKSYGAEPKRHYPVIYIISGFSGTIEQLPTRYAGDGPVSYKDSNGVEFIRILLSGECKWGHHVFANSSTNGPRGDALVKELIPHIDREFRTVADPRARFVAGHSSGGWSSLWLQINYPDFFGGVWSTAPDPVDFRDYQQIDLYANPTLNMYVDTTGERRPLARMQGRVLLWYDDFTELDDTIGRGGQLRSFEAVFSPLGEDGLPKTLWDRKTGKIDPEVSMAWRKYDIRLVLQENWKDLREKLAGKIHVTMGTADTFYLNGATELLAKSLKELGSDAEIVMVDGANHFNVINEQLRERESQQMAESYLRYFRPDGTPR